MKLTLKPGQRLFFTSDTHYSQENIVRGVSSWTGRLDQTRNFQTVDQMNQQIVDCINNTVGVDDILIHLGDWSLGGFDQISKFRERITCSEIHIIPGNHDKDIKADRDGIQGIFSSVQMPGILRVIININTPEQEKVYFNLSHFPLASWEGIRDGVIHLHGHMHFPESRKLGPGKMMDVGIDGNNFKPVSLSTVLNVMEKQPIRSMYEIDHHIK